MLNNIVITDIKKTKRGFNAIFTENGFEVSIDDLILQEYNLEIGSCISQQEFVCIKQLSDNQKRIDKAFTLLSYRMHSKKELKDKLLKYYDEYTVNNTINRLSELNYLDDEKYAYSKRSYLINIKNHSLKDTSMRLMSVGVDKSIVDSVLLEFDTESQKDNIKELLNKKYRSRLSQPDKIYASLIRKGFSYSDIKIALDEYLNNLQEE